MLTEEPEGCVGQVISGKGFYKDGGLASFNQYKIKSDHFYIDCIFCIAIAHYL